MGVDGATRAFAVLLFGLVLGGAAAAQTNGVQGGRERPQASGWEFTRWGMTLSDVLNSSKGRALPLEGGDEQKFRSCTGGQHICRARIANYRAGSLAFDVLFGFDRLELLALVALETRGADRFDTLEQQFTAAWGKPVGLQDGTARIRTWDHEQKGTTISLRSEADFIVINYTPLRAPNL
jgi:hypothetical protein